jgi:hypothetical protein
MSLPRSPPPARLEVVTAEAGVNEDLAGNSPPFYWVLDGSTPLFGKNVRGFGSDALWLVETIDARLRKALTDRADRDLEQILRSVATVLGREFKRAGIPEGPEGPSAAIGLVRLRASRLDYAILGDITVVVRSGRRVEAVRDERVVEFDRAAVELLTRELSSGATYDHARRAVHKALRENRKYMNAQPGYWILSNKARAAHHAVTGSLEVTPGSEILVASDGFSRVVDTFRLYRGWTGLLSEVRAGSLASAIRRLRTAERKDPQCRRYPRLSPADDATALYIRTPR